MSWLDNLSRWIQRKPKTRTSAVVFKEPEGIYVLQVFGVLSKSTTDQIQATAARDIDNGASDLKLLVFLKDFRGWKKGDDWGDLDFFSRYESHIRRIAVLGERRWESETMMFLAANRRSGEVRYFAESQEQSARAWLSSGA